MELVAIARTVRTRGLKGEIVADILTDFPDRFDELRGVIGVREGPELIGLELESHWFQKGRVILKFRGRDSIEEAEPLLDLDICVPESEAVPLEEEEYYDWQLAGCRIVSVDGEFIGTVKEVMRTGANENLVVQSAEKEYLIPFVKAICPEVDIEGREIRVDLPEGLLDL